VSLTRYGLADGVATITMDDGKVNALSPEMLAELMAGFERAEDEADVVVLTGSGQTFSAGFDLRTEGERWPEMLAAGARLAERILSFPCPVLAACNGNALAMAGFLLLSADYRIGVHGDFKIGLNEVRIGLTIPWFGLGIARHRLTRPGFDRCAITGAILGPDEARAVGFFDEVVDPGDLETATQAVVADLGGVKREAHLATKLRVREQALAGVRDGIERIEGEAQDW
jgi:enoyl-CoA hydratase